ncbi:MAG TPA: hypothetical protein VIB00_02950 [Pyrinomonadaceae bacterium]|jgi:hypothetical protein
MIRIGVTGHRVLTNVESLSAGIDEAIDRIQEVFSSADLVVVSALAEGADRLVAIRVLTRPRARLVVPLPLPLKEYVRDFSSTASKKEFLGLLALATDVVEPPRIQNRQDAYAAVGDYVVRNCNVLLAVWNGEPAKGAGGTAETVALARRRFLPLAWVRTQNLSDKTFLKPAPGGVVFENF